MKLTIFAAGMLAAMAIHRAENGEWQFAAFNLFACAVALWLSTLKRRPQDGRQERGRVRDGQEDGE